MKKVNYMWAALLGCVLLGTGCMSAKTAEPAVVVDEVVEEKIFDFEGIPSDDYLVGGGYKIVYRATVEGDLYIAEKSSNRLLATISLQPGEKHEMEYDINDEKLSDNLETVGIDAKKASFKVYFVPR